MRIEDNWLENVQRFQLLASQSIEMVPVTEIIKYREYNREKKPLNSKKEMRELKAALVKNGFKEALQLRYFHNNKTAILTEGNHRLVLAMNTGVKEVPVTVLAGPYKSEEIKNYKRTPRKVRGWRKSHNPPATVKPSQIGFTGRSVHTDDVRF